ncbi:hypothetical protein TIFTF001_045513 [Ficus carica]|uniref:RlpA-like protein double-psi beta-barrel domain-containing protein n=1 Tax=Ficus carica TaxID=3494 RepID=A0AA88CLY9_FICCA|nr:hypothetical protein TIFTF001_045513 [Ficus carica]
MKASACFGYGLHVAAGGKELWTRVKNSCGKLFYTVKCVGAANLAPKACRDGDAYVIVEIVDYCPGCISTIDLSRDAFSLIADPDAGKIRVH